MKLQSILIITISFFSFLRLEAQTVLDSKKFDAEGIDAVEIKGSFVDIWVSEQSGNMVSFDGQIEGPSRYKGDFEIKSDLSGSTLRIWLERPRNVYGNISGKMTLKLPAGTELTASNSSGDVNVKGLRSKEILLKCSSGDIDARNLSGNIRLDTSSGDITGVNLEGNVAADASSGDLYFAGVDGNLECETSSGSIKVKDVDDTFFTAESSSGDIRLENVSGKVRVESSSGTIGMERVSANISAESTSGDIRGAEIKLTGDSNFEASSGDITINLLNNVDDMSFDLRSSSGDLKVGKNRRAEDRLLLKRGGILVIGRTTSGDIGFY